jgi:hypothetical protein
MDIFVQNNIGDRAEYFINTMNRHDNYMAKPLFVTGCKLDNAQISASGLLYVD